MPWLNGHERKPHNMLEHCGRKSRKSSGRCLEETSGGSRRKQVLLARDQIINPMQSTIGDCHRPFTREGLRNSLLQQFGQEEVRKSCDSDSVQEFSRPLNSQSDRVALGELVRQDTQDNQARLLEEYKRGRH